MQEILSRKKPQVKCLFDINLRPHCYSKKVIIKSLKHAYVLKLNAEEFDTLQQMMGFGKNTNQFADYLINDYSLERSFPRASVKLKALYLPPSNYTRSLNTLLKI